MSDEKALTIPDNQIIFRPSSSIKFSETGLTISGSISYERWEGAVELLANYNARSDMFFVWAWGDLLTQGQARFGEQYSQAMDRTGKAYQTLANYKWVAEHTARHLRAIPNLTLAHYLRVGKIKDDGVKAHLLMQASENGWSASTDLPREIDKLLDRLPAPEREKITGGERAKFDTPPPATKDDQIYELIVERHSLTNDRQTTVLRSGLITEKINEAIELIAPLLGQVEPGVKETLTQVIDTLCSIPNGDIINLVNQAINQYRQNDTTGLVDTMDQLIATLEDSEK